MSKIDYSKIDVENFLNELGMNNVKIDGKEIFFSCPFEGHSHGDLNPSASMQQGTTKTHCFGCGFNGNALTFLAEYENVSPLKAAKFIRDRFGDGFQEPEGSFFSEIEAFLNKKEEIKVKRNEPLDEKELLRRDIDWNAVWAMAGGSDLHYMFERGFTWSTLDEWHIGYDDISERITIPWFDEEMNLIGFKGRALERNVGDGNARYKVLGGPEYGFDTFDMSFMFFGYQKLPMNREPPLIIVEGELNTIALDQAGVEFRLGISGKHISKEQAYILGRMDRDLILWFDDVKDEMVAADKLLASNKVFIIPEHDKDPADSTAEEIRDLLSKAKSAII